MQATIERIDDVTVAILPCESLDASNAKDFKQGISPLLTAKAKVVFDLSHVQFVDSSGLGGLLSCLRQLHASGGELKLCGMAESVYPCRSCLYPQQHYSSWHRPRRKPRGHSYSIVPTKLL